MDTLTATSLRNQSLTAGLASTKSGAAAAYAKTASAAGGASVKVAISSEGRALADADTSAQDDPMKERLDKMREAVARIQAMPSGTAQRKEMARARIQQLRERIEAMRQMMVGLSPAAAKAMAREMKAMAQELKSAAGTLMEGSGPSVGDVGDVGATTAAGAGASGAASAANGAATDAAAEVPVDAAASTTTVSDAGMASAAADAASSAARASAEAPASAEQLVVKHASAKDTSELEDKDDATIAALSDEEERLAGVAGAGEAEQAEQDATAIAATPDIGASRVAALSPSSDDAQLSADRDLIRKVAAALKSLMAMVKSQMHDPAHDKEIRAAEHALGTTPGAGPA